MTDVISVALLLHFHTGGLPGVNTVSVDLVLVSLLNFLQADNSLKIYARECSAPFERVLLPRSTNEILLVVACRSIKYVESFVVALPEERGRL